MHVVLWVKIQRVFTCVSSSAQTASHQRERERENRQLTIIIIYHNKIDNKDVDQVDSSDSVNITKKM